MKDIIYDEFGQRTKLSLGNGVVNEYTYDQNTRRLSHLKSFKGSNVFQNISYKFDAVGNILERVNKDFVTSGSVKKTSKQTYEYDNLYRLTSSEGEYTKESWLPYFSDRTNIYTSSTSYNRVGNITHKMVDNRGIYPELGNDMRTLKDTTYDREYTYGGAQPHAVTKAGDLVMGYDANGNMTTKEWTKYGVKMSMTWNSENRMTESVSQNVYSGAKTLTRYKYDYEGNRVVKSSNYGEVVTPTPEISYRNDSIVTKHIFVSGVRVASKVCDDKSSNTYYQSVDHLGSTNVLTDDKGEFYEHIETFPDGSIWVKEYVNQSGVNTVFTCHEMDVETKFFYAKARYYDAQLGRFISVDPIINKYLNGEINGGISNPNNLNLYQYCYNNPLKYTDPTGKWTDPTTNPEIVSHFERWSGDRAGVHNPRKSSYGLVRKNRDGSKRGHGGVDIRTNIGQKVYAVSEGTVVRLEGNRTSTRGFGLKIVLRFTYKYSFLSMLKDILTLKWITNPGLITQRHEMDGKKFYAWYTHLDSANVRLGQAVKEGFSIGTAGRSGNAQSGRGIPKYRNHLHFSISNKKWATGNRNVYSGEWVDPTPFFNNLDSNPADNRKWQDPDKK